jgi:hypothetical protein
MFTRNELALIQKGALKPYDNALLLSQMPVSKTTNKEQK